MHREINYRERKWWVPILHWFKIILKCCVAQESIISFLCKYKVLCVSQMQHCTNTHNIKHAELPMMTAQSPQYKLHITQKERKGFCVSCINVKCCVAWSGWTFLTYWIFTTYPSGEKPIKNGWKEMASWTNLLFVCLSVTFKVDQSNFPFCQLSELVTVLYCVFAVTWFWWCVKFRLRAGSKEHLYRLLHWRSPNYRPDVL